MSDDDKFVEFTCVGGHIMVAYHAASIACFRKIISEQAFKSNFGKVLLPISFAASLAGCVTHPIQQDVTGLPTKLVVDRIRCETKLAVLDKAIRKLRDRAREIRQTVTPLAQLSSRQKIIDNLDNIADRLAEQGKTGGPIDFNPADLTTEDAIRFYNHFINTAIAYEFTFDISEINNAGLSVDPVRLITSGTAGLTVGAGVDLTRNNIRRFTLIDTFGELLTNERLRCDPDANVADNISYPVAGSIGLHEIIDTFVDLAEGQLRRTSAADATVFGDTLKFTTSVTGGVTPHVQIDAIGNRFGVASPSNVRLQATRTDIHTLAIGLSMGAEGHVPLPKGMRVKQRGGEGQLRPSAAPRSGANVERALDNLDEQRSKNLSDRLGSLIGR